MQTTQRSVYTRIDSYVGGYLESVPNDYTANPTKKYPLLISLHGIGERGDGSAGVLEKVANIGIPFRLKKGTFPASFSYGGEDFSFIVICPQINGSSWEASIENVINYAKANYRVDEERVYLTGLSMGGIYSWIYASKTVERGKGLAAMLLVTPGATASASQLSNISSSQLPIWVTNNSGDSSNKPAGAIALVNAINSTVPAPPKALLTIFTKSGHDAWTATYDPAFEQDGLNVYEWMLSKKRASAQSTTSTPVLTASAGTSQVITLPTNTATLDASGSKVTSGTITSYTWTKLSGPSSGTLTLVSNGLQANLTDLVAGVYTYQLTVKDSNGSTASATVTVTVNAASTGQPTANAGSAQTITLPTSSVTLDGSSSTAASGTTISSYKWVKASGPSGGNITSWTSVKTTATDLTEGTYVFNLTVTGSNGISATAGVTITVKAASTSTSQPTANAGSAQTITLPTSSVTLDGSSSTAASGTTISSYKWVKASGPSGGNITSWTSVKTTATDLTEGTYIFNLTVTGSNGISATAGVTITVKAAASAASPTAVGWGGSITLPTSSITLSAVASTPAAGSSIASYSWVKSSGPSSCTIATPSGVQTLVSNLTEGTYKFKLTVTDKNGQSASTDVQVVVYAASTALPTAVGWGGSITLPTSSITLSAVASTPAPGSSIASYSWVKSSGPSSCTIATPSGVQTLVSNLTEGIYKFKLTVTDKNGQSASTDVQVVVYAAVVTASPTAVGWGGSITLPTSSITLSAVASTPAPGSSIASYSWVKSSGPSSCTIATPSGVQTVVSNLTEGVYKFKLTVTDKNGQSASTDVQVVVYASSTASRTISGITTEEVVAAADGSILSRDGVSSVPGLKISPNPVKSDMNISLGSDVKGKISLIVHDLTGKSLLQQEFTKEGTGAINRNVNISRLPAGIYIVQVIVDGKYRKALRIVKQ
ncbi:MAG: T9SS type A sorting domain-containing protein [Agriterribacter sp.]